MKIVLIEKPDEVNRFINKRGQAYFSRNDILTVALEPAVQVTLKDLNINSVLAGNYVQEDKKQKIFDVSDKLTLRFVQAVSFEGIPGFEKAFHHYLYHYFFTYLTHFLWNVELLTELARTHSVKQFAACVPFDRTAMYQHTAEFHPKERFTGLFAREFSAIQGYKFDCINHDVDDKNSLIHQVKKSLGGVNKKLGKKEYHKLSQEIRFGERLIFLVGPLERMIIVARHIKSNHPNVKIIYLADGDIGWNGVMHKMYIARKSYLKKLDKRNLIDGMIFLDALRDTCLPDPKQEFQFKNIFEVWSNHILNNQKRYLQYQGVNLSMYLSDKINYGLKWSAVDFYNKSVILSRIFHEMKPSLIISYNHENINNVIGEIAKKCNLETLDLAEWGHFLSFSEGSKVPQQLKFNKGINTYKKVAVQTPVAEKLLDNCQDNTERLYTGPLVYYKASENARRIFRDKIIEDRDMQIMAHFSPCAIRNGNIGTSLLSSEEYLKWLRELVRTIHRLKDAVLVIHLPENPILCKEELQEFLMVSRKIVIDTQTKIDMILSAADIVVGESLMYMEEAIYNNVPFLLYDINEEYETYKKYNKESLLKKMNSPLYYQNTSKDLDKFICEIFENSDLLRMSDKEKSSFRFTSNNKVFDQYVQKCIES